VAIMASDMALKPHLSIMFDGQCEAAFITLLLNWKPKP
jgi:hypothetical protein